MNHSRSNCLTPGITLRRKPQSSGPKALLDLDFVYDWFHDSCPLVEVDKSKRNTYKGRRIRCANKIRVIYCDRKVRNGLKKDLVRSFLASDVYKDWMKRTGRCIGEKTIASCICFCIKEAKHNECVCKICVQFRYLLKAWDTQRKLWHANPCTCPGCVSSKFNIYMGASKSSSAFKAAILCQQKAYPHLTLPHLPEEVPYFYPLACCKNRSTPKHVQGCEVCGWRNKFYKYHNCVERTEHAATWMKWQQTELATTKKQTRSVLREFKGRSLVTFSFPS